MEHFKFGFGDAGSLRYGFNNRTSTSKRKLQHKQMRSEEFFQFLFWKLSFPEVCLLFFMIFLEAASQTLLYHTLQGEGETSYFPMNSISNLEPYLWTSLMFSDPCILVIYIRIILTKISSLFKYFSLRGSFLYAIISVLITSSVKFWVIHLNYCKCSL